MSEDELLVLAIKGAISEMPIKKREETELCITAIRELFERYGFVPAATAVALIGAECQAGKITP